MNKDIEILVVENESSIVNTITDGLKEFGFTKIRSAFTSFEALEKIKEKNPKIILLDISLEKKYSGIYLARTIEKEYRIPVVFITGGVDSKTGDLIEQSSCYGVLFKPFRSNTLRIVIKMAIERDEVVEEIKKNSKGFKDKLREINAFFSVSRLISSNDRIDEIMNKSLEIFPQAFRFGDKISLRITYRGRQYLSKGFKETKWVLSEEICKDRGKENLVELYLDIAGEGGKFPFTIEEIETFTSLVKQLSLIIDKKETDNAVKKQLSIQEFTVTVLHDLINNANMGFQDFTKLFLKQIKEKLNFRNAHIVTFRLDGFHLRKYSIKKEQEGEEFVDAEFIEKVKNFVTRYDRNYIYIQTGQRNSDPEDPFINNLKLELGHSALIIIPSRLGISIVALIVLRIDYDDHLHTQEKEYLLLGEVFSLGINKINREKKIITYRQAIEQNPASVVITGLDGIITYVNPGFSEVTGFKYEEAVGQNSSILKSGYQEEEFYKELWDTITKGKIWKGTFQNKRKNGEIFWEEAYISPIKDDNGTATGYIAVKEDITEKINAKYELLELNKQLKKTQSSLVMEEKLASIGRLAAGVAHELNNPIGFIYSNFRTIKKYFEKYQGFIKELSENENCSNSRLDEILDKYKLKFIGSDMEDLLNESNEGFDRVINIINSLRNFSRVDQLRSRVRYNFNDALTTTLTVAKNQIKYAAEIETRFVKIPDIYCNSSEINQVLLNIIINAVQAIKSSGIAEHGKIVISTFTDRKWVGCRIEDNGPGIAEDILPNIFEPFFTTKPIGEGTGLGLNISYDIVVNKHKGELLAGNNDHGGAFFIIKLPRETEGKGDG